MSEGLVLQVPTSIGDLFDRLTILEIKAARIDEAQKIRNVSYELGMLRAIASKLPPSSAEERQLVAELKSANGALWDIEEAIRGCELKQDFGADFVSLARAVYKTNDRCAELKKQLNLLSDSEIIEEKSYKSQL